MKKIIIAALVLVLCFSVCSCTYVQEAQKEVKKIEEFATKAVEISSISDPEIALEKAEDLIHPNSKLDVQGIIEQVIASDTVQALDVEEFPITSYEIGEFGAPNLSFNDPTLGGNVYEIQVVVTIVQDVNGATASTPLNVDVRLLSTEWGIGLYDFTID